MRKLLLLLMLCLGSVSYASILAPLASYPSGFEYKQLETALEAREFSQACTYIDRWISKPDAKASFLLVEKAKILFVSQRHAEAEETFLEALAKMPVCETSKASPAEQKAFETLLSDYIGSTRSGRDAEQFSCTVKSLLAEHPEWLLLKHYLAASLANAGNMVEFFPCFAEAYQVRPQCYLRWKTIGVLHLRLFEETATEEPREYHRKEAIQMLKEAFFLQPNDSTLLIKIMFLLLPEERRAFIHVASDHVMHQITPMCRSDCAFLIEFAIDTGEFDIAEKLIEKARTWYEYSRLLGVLSAQLNEKKKQGRQ